VIVPTVSMTVRRIVMANDPPTVRTTVNPIVRAPALAERLGMMAPTMSGASDDPCRPAIDLHAATTVRGGVARTPPAPPCPQLSGRPSGRLPFATVHGLGC
jgi:hypothetical protein